MRQIVNIVGVVTLNQQAAFLAHAARQMKAEEIGGR